MSRPHSAQSSQSQSLPQSSQHSVPQPSQQASPPSRSGTALWPGPAAVVPPTRVLLDALRRPGRAAAAPADSERGPADSSASTAGIAAATTVAATTPTATTTPTAAPASRWRRWLLWLFWGASVGAAAVLATALVFRLHLRQAPPAGTLALLYTMLTMGSASLAALLLSLLSTARATLRHPLGALADRIDADTEAENALLLALRRLPPLALRARQRRIQLQLHIWEGVSRTVLLLIALGPLALGIVTGVVELPRKGGTLVPLLSLYGAAFVFGAALALFVQLQCSSPLRRLAHVLREAAEIGVQLQRRGPADETAHQAAQPAPSTHPAHPAHPAA